MNKHSVLRVLERCVNKLQDLWDIRRNVVPVEQLDVEDFWVMRGGVIWGHTHVENMHVFCVDFVGKGREIDARYDLDSRFRYLGRVSHLDGACHLNCCSFESVFSIILE